MLKIKNNVPLEELEKFGFNKKGDDYKYFDDDTDEYIGVQENGYIYVENYNPGLVGAIVEEKALDKLYDLIKAGLVEKVSDD